MAQKRCVSSIDLRDSGLMPGPTGYAGLHLSITEQADFPNVQAGLYRAVIG